MAQFRFRVVEALGAGAMGSVFAADDLWNGGARVALKALWPSAEDGAIVASLRAEFGLLAALRDPLLGRVFDFGRLPAGLELPARAPAAAGGLFYTRELVPGVDLASAAADEGRRLGAICLWLASAARGLEVLHQAGLRHGDFKPKNAIATGEATSVRLIDFGLATAENRRRPAGTLAYMAPEILAGRAVDRRADLYALGISLHELCAGRLPSGERSGASLVDWHLGGERPSLRGERRDAPAALVDLCAQLTARDPDDRLPSAAEAALALESCADKVERGGKRRRSPRPAQAAVRPGAAPVFAGIGQAAVAALERAFERRRAGQGGAAMIELVGDAGSGKSTVLTELAWRVQLAGGEVLRGDLGAVGRPLGVLGAALDRLDLAGPGAGAAPAEGPGQAALAIAGALADASRRFPILLLFDDLDYADEGSRAMVPAVALALRPRAAVLVVATRTAAGDATVREQPAATGQVARLSLEPLSAREVEEIVARAAGRRDPRLAEWVHRQTGGNLLHLVHTVAELARRGFPVAEKLAGLEMPGRLAAWERAQLDAAGDDERAACEALAVLGAPAGAALVGRLLEIGADRAAGLLRAAAARGLVATAAGGGYRIARPSAAQALVRSLDPARRAELHRRAAAAIDEVSDPDAPLWHLIRAGERAAVAGQIAPAVARLRAAGDHAGALALAGAARDLLGPDDPALSLAVGELAQLCGDLARAEAALAALAAAGPGDAARRARLTLARACDAGGKTERAQQLFRAVIAESPNSDEAAFAARDLAAHHIRHGQTAEALAVADQALARAAGPARGHLSATRAFARGQLGTDSGARAELEELAAGGEPALVAAALNWAGRLSFAAGDYRAAQAQYQAALVAAEAIGDAGRIAVLRMNLAAMAYSFGDFAGSLANYVPALSLLRAAGLATNEVLARRNFGHLLIELGEYEQARVELAAAGRDAALLGLAVQEIGAEALRGIADWRTGDLEGARARLAEARARFGRLGDARREAETLLDLAELELDAADAGSDPARLPAARAHLDAAAAIAATRDDAARRARFLVLSADQAARAGARDQARGHLDELAPALASLDAQGGRQLEWDLHRNAARVAERLGDGGAAARHRGRALTILEEIAAGLPEARRIAFWHDPRRRHLRRQAGASTTGSAPAFALAPASRPIDVGSTLDASSSPERMIDKLFRLLDIYRRLSTERDVDRLLELAMDTAIELSGCERGFLLLAGADGALRTAVARNLPVAALADLTHADSAPAADPDRLPYSRSIAERVFAGGEVIAATDARLDPRFLRAESVHALHQGRVLCLPIHARGLPAGVLYLEARASARPISDDDVRLLMAFGDQVAVVLDSARLLRENARRADELEAARGEIEGLLAERTELLEQRTEELATARRDLESVHRRFLGARGAFGIVGRSPAMERVFQLIDRAAAADVPVLVLGESGTGKELVARALHEYGRRQGKPLVSLNCAAVPESLLESELFGHVRGAFTGADRARRGLFEAADGGTLFLDEIADTPLRMQASLLRALQEGVIRPVGDTRDVSVDVRIIAATHRPLEELVASGAFRQDLYYRLHVVAIELPPLRERREDIPLLVEHFISAIAERTGLPARGVTRRAVRAMRDMPWPGNVRQLEHALTQLAVLAEGEVIDDGDLASLAGPGAPQRRTGGGRATDDRRAREKRRILEALEASGWNRSKAAEALGMPRRTFYRRLADHDIQ